MSAATRQHGMTQQKPEAPKQPWMHDMKVLVNAPSQLWACSDGTIDGRSISGFFVADTRFISSIKPTIDDEEPVPVAWSSTSNVHSSTVFLPRGEKFGGVDPRVRLTADRTISGSGLSERLTLENGLDHELCVSLRVAIVIDMSTMQEIKGGVPSSVLAEHAIAFSNANAAIDVACRCGRLRLSYEQAEHSIHDNVISLRWSLRIAAGSATHAEWSVGTDVPVAAVAKARGNRPWKEPVTTGVDPRLSRWVQQSLRDLDGLRMTIPALPEQQFLAAGAPWFFTLFGRDSLWSARFMLPLGTKLAEGTLSTLAYFQATTTDIETGAEPGKIPHELRAESLQSRGEFGDSMQLPPLYYGTIDATELWVILLGESVRRGMPETRVRPLLKQLKSALQWMRSAGDADGDGLLEYIDRTGHGLSNQGWKDSSDSIRWRNGSRAVGPIALCEVQGYAYQAAMLGAEVLDRFDEKGSAEIRQWAERLRTIFNERFWVHDNYGSYPAVALDGKKRPVNSATSNIGHLLGTGILDEAGVAKVVARLLSDDLLSGYGIRTLSSDNGGYSPLSYHCGSVWMHDSAIAMMGLESEGYHNEAKLVGRQLIDAAELFDYHVPELYSGDGPDRTAIPYPAACHPQAWSAAAAIQVLAVEADVNSDQRD